MSRTYQHLGVYSNWADAAKKAHKLYPIAPPGKKTQQRVREILGFHFEDERPHEVRVERRWKRDGLEGEEVSWSVGYGPRTHAWVLKPEGAKEPLPGVVALHDHGGFKYYGKEKIADGPDDTPPMLISFREAYYGGRAFANALAKEGFVVLVPDVFLWGSRKFPLETLAEVDQNAREMLPEWQKGGHSVDIIQRYNAIAAGHEHLVEKYCHLLGTTLAGVVSYEDRVAVEYLASRSDVRADVIGCVGLSGGGCRSALLQATCDRIRAAVIVGMMSTWEHLLDHNVVTHTWMLLPWGWARYGDWTDLAACRAPSPLLVQYDLDDGLFTQEGMRAAHQRLSSHYHRAGAPDNYVGEFYPGGHKFDLQMQASAFAWLKKHLG
ncbi:MAG: dienelactone hydrolase family protein [Armatimonadota bacterium]